MLAKLEAREFQAELMEVCSEDAGPPIVKSANTTTSICCVVPEPPGSLIYEDTGTGEAEGLEPSVRASDVG